MATSATDRAYAITEEMAARARDPRCPRALALLIVAWVNALNRAIAELTAYDSEMTPEEIERAQQIGPPDFLLDPLFDAENGAGASDELRRLAAENTGLPACPFCGGELCAVVLEGDVPGVSCGGCGAYTSRLPWREPWLYEGRRA